MVAIHRIIFNNSSRLLWGESRMMCKNVLLFKGDGEISNSYFLLEKEADEKSIYGIMISNDTDSDYEEGVSENREEVITLIEKFFKNNASPLHLVELIDDYML